MASKETGVANTLTAKTLGGAATGASSAVTIANTPTAGGVGPGVGGGGSTTFHSTTSCATSVATNCSTLRRAQDPDFPETLREPLSILLQNALDLKGSPSAGARVDQLEIELRKHALEKLRKMDMKKAAKSTAIAATSNCFGSSAAAASHSNSSSTARRNTAHPINVSEADDKMEVDVDVDAADNEDFDKDDVLGDIGCFWTETLELCLHLVHFDEAGTDERYKGMNARKLPLLVLEDILDSLPIKLSQSFWEHYAERAADGLFSKLLWDPHPDATPPPRPCWLLFLRLCNNLLRRSCPQWAARVMLTLAMVYPLSEKSATKVWGSRNTDHVDLESRTEFENHHQQHQNQHQEQNFTKDQEDGAVPDYNFYESFWSLQRDFASPFVKNVAVFLKRLRSLLGAVEAATQTPQSHCTSLSDLASEKSPATYLTSSRLLSLQLSDPDFCIHVLTQFIIVAHHFSSEAPRLGDQLSELQHRARVCIKRMVPLGPQHLQVVERVLSTSELQWRNWKKNKCQPSLDAAPITNKPSSSSARKRKRLESVKLLSSSREGSGNLYLQKRKKKAPDREESAYTLLQLRQDIPGISQTMRRLQPSIDAHLAEYVDALDPESGIEADYHPKNNVFFNWQALRVLSAETLLHFGKILPNGDFEPLIRKVQKDLGNDIPGEAPTYEDLDQERLNDETEADAATVGTVGTGVTVGEGTAVSVMSGVQMEDETGLATPRDERDMMSPDNMTKDDHDDHSHVSFALSTDVNGMAPPPVVVEKRVEEGEEGEADESSHGGKKVVLKKDGIEKDRLKAALAQEKKALKEEDEDAGLIVEGPGNGAKKIMSDESRNRVRSDDSLGGSPKPSSPQPHFEKPRNQYHDQSSPTEQSSSHNTYHSSSRYATTHDPGSNGALFRSVARSMSRARSQSIVRGRSMSRAKSPEGHSYIHDSYDSKSRSPPSYPSPPRGRDSSRDSYGDRDRTSRQGMRSQSRHHDVHEPSRSVHNDTLSRSSGERGRSQGRGIARDDDVIDSRNNREPSRGRSVHVLDDDRRPPVAERWEEPRGGSRDDRGGGRGDQDWSRSGSGSRDQSRGGGSGGGRGPRKYPNSSRR